MFHIYTEAKQTHENKDVTTIAVQSRLKPICEFNTIIRRMEPFSFGLRMIFFWGGDSNGSTSVTAGDASLAWKKSEKATGVK